MNVALEKEKKIYDSEKIKEIVEIKRNHINEVHLNLFIIMIFFYIMNNNYNKYSVLYNF